MISKKRIIEILLGSPKTLIPILPSKQELTAIATKKADQILAEIKTFTDSTWLTFDPVVRPANCTTDLYNVLTKDIAYMIGIIKWDTIALSYCFYPNPHTVLTTTQLEDITAFIHTCMTEWRKKKKSNADRIT
jgi:hypothetical protein